MGRAPCCEKVGIKKGPWTTEEDQKLIAYVQEHGHGSWRALPKKAGLQRCGKSCRLRWTNYLRPDIIRGKFSLHEEQNIIQLHALLGNRWSAIASYLPKRTDNEIKNYWNTHLKKRLLKMGIDPVTHKPKSEPSCLMDSKPSFSSTLSHMAQWESARLEAEARLARESQSRSKGLWSGMRNGPKYASVLRNWDSQSYDPPSITDIGLPASGIFKQSGAVDFSNLVRNWGKALKDHTDTMLPGSLSKPKFGVAGSGKIAISYNLLHGEQIERGSPTSTLSSFEKFFKNAPESGTATKAALSLSAGLSWPDEILKEEEAVDSSKGEMVHTYDGEILQPEKISWQLEEALRSAAGGDVAVDGQNMRHLFSTLHDTAIAPAVDASCPRPPSPFWSLYPERNGNHEVYTSESERVPSLASATTSSNLHGEQQELVSQDITSNQVLFQPLANGEISPEELMDLADESRLQVDAVTESAAHCAFGAVPFYNKVEDMSEYWKDMLKQLVDPPMALLSSVALNHF